MSWFSQRRSGAPLFLLVAAPCLMGTTAVGSDFESRWLAAHNQERALLGLTPLRWNDDLANGAARWAQHLATTGQFSHSPNEEGQRIGENIWGGTTGRYAPERMVGRWLAEKRYFQSGVFPSNSTSGRSSDVSHYTQIVWRTSTDVGCSLSQGKQQEILVCRYATAGNVWGQSPF